MAEKAEIIKVDLLNEADFVHEYNEDEISADLVKYLVDQYNLIDKKKKVKIVVNNKCNSEKKLKKMITKGIRRELDKNVKKNRFHDKERAIFFISGLIVLIIAFMFLHLEVVKELFLIFAWIFIWEAVELDIFEDFEIRKRRRTIKKLLKCKIEVVNFQDEEIEDKIKEKKNTKKSK